MLVWIVCAALILGGLLLRHPYFFQDVQYVLYKIKVRRFILKCMRTNYLILDRFLDLVKTQPHKLFIYFKDETFTYRDADLLSNKAARALLQSGCIKEGDTVALFLENQPMFLWLWLALVKIGCSGTLLNNNIRSKSLLHCLNCSGAKTLVAAEELLDAVKEVLPHLLEQQVTVFILTDRCKTAGLESFKDKMNEASSEPLPKALRSHLTLQSPAVYIYTSGTTGLPKAAVVTHGKLWSLSLLLAISGVDSKDVIYNSLPLYHSTGLLVFTGAIERGIPVVLRSKFSTSQFWDDCRKYNVTVIQYIGEIMRYLCNTPQKLSDKNHKVRLAIGNGMRADVWRDFVRRFGDIQIREFYGATEGNFSLLNYSGKVGAIGRDTFLNKWLFPYAVIKYDIDKGEPLRDSSGFCIEAAKGEPGLLVTEITAKSPFVGYARDLQQTEKKKLHNVFKKGDLYFNTGDLLHIDEDNFIYFSDRVGDTFRWKGENVATAEVADILTLADCIKEANVYGVKVPGQEGRAGMAAVTLGEGLKFDSSAVFKHVENFLPTYARPRFIRIQVSLDVTGTFKLIKTKLVEQGFNTNEITDRLYFLNEKEKNYTPLTPDVFDSVIAGSIKI
ncbi:very long-chain acyl-CoA synthetase-like [Archocentrus centrarchus]|uniref:very long-chain acyl-CoA synthetase-like n=1 Tax=Archocentrus centrarchus TaxID=63155 RepID=UPI0011EA0D48|nr:very long-chain acyl-CoA synthetase-like [Archocentrus centrarchus]